MPEPVATVPRASPIPRRAVAVPRPVPVAGTTPDRIDPGVIAVVLVELVEIVEVVPSAGGDVADVARIDLRLVACFSVDSFVVAGCNFGAVYYLGVRSGSV